MHTLCEMALEQRGMGSRENDLSLLGTPLSGRFLNQACLFALMRQDAGCSRFCFKASTCASWKVS